MTLRTAAVLMIFLFAAPVPSSGQATVHLFVNDVDLTRQIHPIVQDGVPLLPAGLVAGAFGAAVDWDGAAHQALLTGASGAHVRLTAGLARADADGAVLELPAAPVFRDGVLWLPAVAVLRALGAYIAGGDDGSTWTALAQVTGVSWRLDSGRLVVRISATGPVQAQAYALHQPERLVVDLGGAVAHLPASQDIGTGGVMRVRAGQFQRSPFITRVVFDLDHAMKFTLGSRLGEVAVALGDATTAVASPPAASPPPAPARTPPTTSAAPVSGAPPAATPQGAGPAPSGPASQAAPVAPPAPPATAPAAPLAPSLGSAGPADRRTSVDAVPPVPAPEPLAVPPLPDFADGPGAFHVQAVAYDDQDQTGRITIHASQHVAYTLRSFVYPDRLAIDIAGGVYIARRQDIEVDSEAVRNIVVSQFQLKPNLTRVLVHLNHKLPYSAVVTDGGRRLVVTLGNPGRRLARVSAVIIDPGHGGSDGGAVGPSGLREADVALAIARLVHDDLAGQDISSVMTRTDDSTLPLEERPDLAVRNGGIVFVSIHANGSRSIGSAGTETYYKTPASQALARVMQAEVTQALGEPDRGVRTADFYVLVNTPMPAVLVETAFITNPSEEAMLRDPAVQQRIADAIARAIAKYLTAEGQPGSFVPDRTAAGPAADGARGSAGAGRAVP
ncbi:MAG TPA: N-acetylmuramoyl-L-alanine amidase family protein [bacterium]|nr:N-acetylmuramoyl-L-alanine amidase family protein [bacterium]